MNRSLALLALLIFTLTGCGGMKPEDFQGQEPRLVLEDYFAGRTRGWGLFEDRFGNLRRQFVVDIDGSWDGETLTLVEDFRYDDGETEQRIWTIRKTGPDSYEGRAEDVIGTASGRAAGNALNWRYQLSLRVGDGRWTVSFDDWLFLQPDGVLLNRARVSKFGIEIGQVSLFFRPLPERQAAARPALAAE